MTIEIPLTQGKVALIDDEDLPLVAGRKWYVLEGYATSDGRPGDAGKVVLMHGLLISTPAGLQVDHIDGNRLDNRRRNLRLATRQEQARNRKRRSDNTSGYKGVSKAKNGTSKAWTANVWEKGKRIFYASFDNPIDAARAYDAAARKHFGEFARTNF